MHSILKQTRNLTIVALLGVSSAWAAHPSRGLWVGEVALNAVNEATGAVGDSNTYEFTDPAITTPTSDIAYLRLILHVNGAGQVSLLKSVAIVQTGNVVNGVDEIRLITNPEFYPSFPGIARRVASAFYDFGDPGGADAMQTLIDEAVATAVTEALDGQSEAAIELAINAVLDDIVENADVDSAYLNTGASPSFITDDFFALADVELIADTVAALIHDNTLSAVDFNYQGAGIRYAPFPVDPLGSAFEDSVKAAERLEEDSFYGDTRGTDGIVNIVVAAAAAVDALDPSEPLATKEAAARLAAIAEWHNAADLEQAYNRFLATTEFSSLPNNLTAPAVQTAIARADAGDTESEIFDAVVAALELSGDVPFLTNEATDVFANSLNGDPRAQLTLAALLDAVAEAATTQVLVSNEIITVTNVVEAAVLVAFDSIVPAPVFATAPSPEYIEFVAGSVNATKSDYAEAATLAAETAASEVKFQLDAGEDDPAALAVLTERALLQALIGFRNQAASLPLNSVALEGELASGGVVSGSFQLPALAPTNPFLHRLHPDHSVGIAITRKISIEVDAPEAGGDFTLAGYGVSELKGTYNEEIFGLHKPLGNNQDTGLKTQGSFTLNRLTLADTLNF
jgi:hypothetical protein